MSTLFSRYKTDVLVFLFCIGTLLGSGYITSKHYNFTYALPDTESYMSMAKGNYNTNVTHKYRPIIPLIVYGLEDVIGTGYSTLKGQPYTAEQRQKTIQFCFFLVNTLFMGLTGCVLYKTYKHAYSTTTILIGLTGILSSQWVIYASSLPLTDSLFFLCLAVLWYGIEKKQVMSLVVVSLVGAITKESFFMFFPLVWWWAWSTQNLRLVLATVLGLGLWWGLKWWIDHLTQTNTADSLHNIVAHQENILLTIQQLMSPKGWLDLFNVFGMFWGLIFLGIWSKPQINLVQYGFVFAVIGHCFLSGMPGRMLFLIFPLALHYILIGLEELNIKKLLT